MTQVTLGNFFTLSNGKNVLGGAGGSGIDTQSLIKSLVDAKSFSINQSKDQIKLNDSQSSALTKFQNLLSTFQSASDALRNPPGVGNESDNAFKYTTATVSGAGSNYVGVTTQAGASLQSYNISAISQLATAATQSTGIFAVSSADVNIVSNSIITGTDHQFAPGTITIKGQDITLAEGDSLNIVASKFNAVSEQTGISATVIQLASGQYELSFVSTDTGAANSFDLSSAGTVSDPSHVLSNLGLSMEQGTGIFTVSSADSSVVPPLSGSIAFAPGTITFNGKNIVISNGDSLNAIAEKFNNVSANTGVRAHVIKQANNQFKLLFTAEPGTSTFDVRTATDPSSVLANTGLTANTGGNTAAAGLDAHFKFNGIAITRSSNDIDDLVGKVTFHLLGTTPDNVTNYAVNVKPDTTIVQNSIVSYVKAYNALKQFAATQTQLNSNGTYADTAILANDQTFRSIMADVTTQVVSQVSGLANGDYSSLADIGITLTTQPADGDNPAVDNILNVDDTQLGSALATHFQQVTKVFGFSLTSNNPSLAVFSNTNALGVTAFTLNINPNTNTFTASYTKDGSPTTVDMTAKALTGGGYSLTGKAGTALEGLVLIYASNSSASISVTATQGIADKTYNTGAAATKANTGLLPQALKTLTDSDTKLNNDISNMTTQVDLYRDQLVKRFAALESAITKVNNLLNSLTANDNARLIASGK